MARFMRLVLAGGTLDGKAIYGPRTAKSLETPILVGPDAIDGWRHGFLSLRYDASTSVIGHNGATLFFRSNMILIPSQGIGIFIAANSDTADGLTEALPYSNTSTRLRRSRRPLRLNAATSRPLRAPTAFPGGPIPAWRGSSGSFRRK
jgi:hypothetical protein